MGYFRNTWSKNLVSWVSCSSVFAAFLMTLALFMNFHGEPFHVKLTSMGPVLPEFGLMMDSLSLWWMLVITGCGFLIHLYSTAYMHDDPSFGRFMAKLNFFIYAMSLLVLSDNFMGLLMGWANVGLASYMLIGFYITKPSASSAAMKAYVMNTIGEVGMIAGIAFIYSTFGSLKFSEVFEKIHAGEGHQMLTMIGLLLLVGAVAKSAQLGLHTWLPYAMEGPTPVSALIHAATMVTAGVYLVSRAWPIYEASATASLWVAWVGGLGALVGALIAAGQNDIKRVLAFSTLSQIGYMFLGNGLGYATHGAGYIAADFHFMTHAFFKACLFLTAGIVVHHYNGDQDIRRMGGAWQKDKFAGWIFAIGTLALIGVPGFAGFFSKDEILLAAWDQNMPLFIIGVIAAGLTAFYNVRLFSLVFLGEPYVAQVKHLGKKNASATKKAHHDDHGHGHGHDDHHHHGTPWQQKVAVGILAALSLVSGLVIFLSHYQVHFLETAFHGLEIEAEGLNLVVAGIATGMAIVGGIISWMWYRPNGSRRALELDLNAKPGALVNMLYFDALYDFVVVTPMKAVAEFISDVADAKIVDGFVNGLAKLSAGLGAELRTMQNGMIRRYALYVFTGVALMLVYFIAYV